MHISVAFCISLEFSYSMCNPIIDDAKMFMLLTTACAQPVL